LRKTVEPGSTFPGALTLAGCCLILCLTAVPVWAHGVDLFARVEGTNIIGSLLYPDGTPIASAPVRAFAPAGELLAETTTDDTGHFSLPITSITDHRILGDAGEGHRAEYTVRASELPESLTPAGSASTPGAAVVSDLDARIERAVARQIAPLREQLFGYERAVRMRDIAGGIGYVFGLAGIVVLLKYRAPRREP
jgi:nickel transport protein